MVTDQLNRSRRKITPPSNPGAIIRALIGVVPYGLAVEAALARLTG